MTIELYSWATPNGHKVHILLEELGLDYNVHAVNIGAGDQFDPAFLKISPNNKIPAILDPDGPDGQPLPLFESGAILFYLAEKHGKFLPTKGKARYEVMQWVMWQMGGLGPMLGQAHHFLRYAPEEVPYAKKRYSNEANRLYNVMDKRLAESRYLAGDDYTIADIAAWPWTRNPDGQNVTREEYPNFVRWHDEIAQRPAVQRGVEVLASERLPEFDDKAKDLLFGEGQFKRR
ncbi:MAG: glutathione S-transferase N-terminal domain-containing protein [Pseudomonadota bacterium]|uniref:glutathione S-transferase N-terminal domain-containing protein n=1 Tax=Fodinicurvata fenggangensis TaxID=1121830 RepID=UPI00047D3157|nr:glutathione S-transferase N-terminal domain-containing protein [Fodinicurvata fenggangensis]